MGFLNIRVFWFMFIAFLPLWYGLIAISYVLIKESIDEAKRNKHRISKNERLYQGRNETPKTKSKRFSVPTLYSADRDIKKTIGTD